VFQTRRSISTESAWQQKRKAIAAEINTLEDYHKDLRDGWVRYLAAEYSGGKAPVAPQSSGFQEQRQKSRRRLG